MLISLAGISVFNTLLFIAVQTTTAINVGLIASIIPGVVILLSWIILKISLSWTQAVGLTISFIGAVLVIIQGNLQFLIDLDFVAGDLWMLAASLCGSFYPILLHNRLEIHPLSLLSIIIVFAAIILLPLFIWDLFQGRYMLFNIGTLSAVFYNAVFPSILAFLFWNRGIHLIGANRAGLYLYLVPVFTATMAYIFLGETLSWYHLLGLTLTIGGMLLFKTSVKNKHI